MTRVRVTLKKCIQDSQDYGSNDEHMVSRVFLSIDPRVKSQNWCNFDWACSSFVVAC